MRERVSYTAGRERKKGRKEEERTRRLSNNFFQPSPTRTNSLCCFAIFVQLALRASIKPPMLLSIRRGGYFGREKGR